MFMKDDINLAHLPPPWTICCQSKKFTKRSTPQCRKNNFYLKKYLQGKCQCFPVKDHQNQRGGEQAAFVTGSSEGEHAPRGTVGNSVRGY